MKAGRYACFWLAGVGHSQYLGPMRYKTPPASLFERNRKKFVAQMEPGTAALFYANDLLPTNADAHYNFTQNSNFYYLTGIDQEDCALFLFPDAPRPELREVLFVRKTSPEIQLWEGWKYSPEEATAASGIAHIQYFSGLNDFFLRHLNLFGGLYLYFNEHERNRLYYPSASHQLAHRMQQQYPGHRILRAAPILYTCRMQKEPEELAQLREAIRLTDEAFRLVLTEIKPGMKEYELEALITYTFMRQGATGHAYTPILASGKNACVLHYIQNDGLCQAGELILMDFGAEYGLYSADLSRTIPVNGRFTERQKAIYQAVYRVMQRAKQRLQPGTLMVDYLEAAEQDMDEELLSLGLISPEDVKRMPAGKHACKEKYFPHGLSHHLGLDTHDVNRWYQPFRAGMVFTVEPGIYVVEEGIGIRLENDVLITEQGPVDLMDELRTPLTLEEIEAAMAR